MDAASFGILNEMSKYGYGSINRGVILGGMKLKSYAAGTLSAVGGLSRVNEEGHEIRVLNKGDGILTAKITKNLSNLGANPVQFLADAGKELMSKLSSVNIFKNIFGGSNLPVYATGGMGDSSINVTNYISGDVNPSTLKALEAAQKRITQQAKKEIMSETLARTHSSRIR